MINSIIDLIFFGLCFVVFGYIIYYNITETSKARKRLREHESTRAKQCKS